MADIGNILEKVNRLFAEWQSLQPISKENADRLWKKFRLEWNYNSNHIEGNTLTYGETQLLLLFDKTTGDHEMREFEEMKAHDVAVAAVRQWATQEGRDITEADIRELNQIILVRPFWKEALTYDGQPTRRQIKVGEYKEYPNSVRLTNGEMFHYASPEEVPIKMHELMDWYRDNQDLSPAILAAEMHYRFILVHPFDDGNGRIARLLVNYIFIKNGLPPIIIKSVDKKNYLTALNKADVGNREAFHEYIAEQLAWSLEIAIKAAKGESVEEDDDLDKEIELLKRNIPEIKASIKKSRAQIQETYLDSLKLLYQKLDDEFSKFNELFIETQHEYKVENGIFGNKIGRANYDLNSINHQILFDYNKPEIFGHVKGVSYSGGKPMSFVEYPEIYEIMLNYWWKGYKNAGINAFNISCSVQTKFEEYKYVVYLFGVDNFAIQKMYGQIITDDEMANFIKNARKHLLEVIKSEISKVG